MFVGSAVVLGFSAWLLFRPGRACPVDPEVAEQCEIVHRWNTRIFWVAIGIWIVGAVAAFLALPLYQWIDGGQ